MRCKMIVRDELTRLELHFGTVELGEVEITEDLSAQQYGQLRLALGKSGLELMDDQKGVLIEKIKQIIIEIIHYSEEPLSINLSEYLSRKLHRKYAPLATLFSEVQGITIEKFFINQKIERVKELLVYDKLTLTEIAFKMNYSSVSHLSAQFKKVTGLTPSYFTHTRS